MSPSLLLSLAGLFGAAPAPAPASSPPPHTIWVEDPSWWHPSCQLSTYATHVFCPSSTQPFWVCHILPPPPGVTNCNCLTNPITQTLTVSAGASAKIGVSKKVCDYDVSAEVEVKAEASLSTEVIIPPCKCVSFVMWKYISITVQLQHNPQWVHSGCPGAPSVPSMLPPTTIKKTIQEFTPTNTRPVPHEYDITTPCSNCPGSPFATPTAESLGGPSVEVAATVSTTPSRTLTQLDVEGAFKGVELKSSFDLALVEIRWLVQQLQPIADQYPDGWIDLKLSSDVSLKGKTVNVIADLKKMAQMLVTSTAYGDFNEDGVRNTADFVLLSNAVFNPPLENRRLYNRMDLNADGVIDQADADVWVLI